MALPKPNVFIQNVQMYSCDCDVSLLSSSPSQPTHMGWNHIWESCPVTWLGKDYVLVDAERREEESPSQTFSWAPPSPTQRLYSTSADFFLFSRRTRIQISTSSETTDDVFLGRKVSKVESYGSLLSLKPGSSEAPKPPGGLSSTASSQNIHIFHKIQNERKSGPSVPRSFGLPAGPRLFRVWDLQSSKSTLGTTRIGSQGSASSDIIEIWTSQSDRCNSGCIFSLKSYQKCKVSSHI